MRIYIFVSKIQLMNIFVAFIIYILLWLILDFRSTNDTKQDVPETDVSYPTFLLDYWKPCIHSDWHALIQ